MKIKKIVSLVLVFVIMAVLIVGVNASTVSTTQTGTIEDSGSCGANGDNVTYVFDSETGTLTISGTGEMMSYTLDTGLYSYRSTAPWNLLSYNINSVVINEGVTSIGDYAFYGNSFTKVKIPSSVTKIGDFAFYSSYKLTDVELPSSVTSIGSFAFALCAQLNNTELPSGIREIGSYAFYQCLSFTSVIIPSSVTSVGQNAFSDCGELTNLVVFPGSMCFGNAAFYGCYKLESAYIYGFNVKFSDDVFYGTDNVTVYGYLDSTSQTFASMYSHKFSALDNPLLRVIPNNTSISETEMLYEVPTTVSFSDISLPSVDKNVLIGLYNDYELAKPVDNVIQVEKGVNRVYSSWVNVGTLNEEADDDIGANVTTSGFDLYGAQLREKTNSWTAGLRFCTRVSKSLLSEITTKTSSDVECGYVLCKKDCIPANSELKVGMTTTDGKTVTGFAAPKKYYDGDTYFVYTAVILNIPDSMESTNIVARPFIKYTDVNGVLRYYYFTENGASNCGGGYYTSYEAVMDKHTAAQGQ